MMQGERSSPRAAISIAMATFNGLPYLRRQIASILGQIDDADQFVIVDDASSDGTWEYLRALTHSAIELDRHAVNRGIRLTFEAALRACRHDIVFLSDQDDVWAPHKRATVQRAFEDRPGTAIVISDARLIDAEDRVVGASFMATRGGFRGDVASTILKNRYLGCAMVLHRDVLELALPVPSRAPMHDMWLGAMGAIQGVVIYLDQPLLDYRRHANNATRTSHSSLTQMVRWRVGFVVAIVSRVIGRRRSSTAWWRR